MSEAVGNEAVGERGARGTAATVLAGLALVLGVVQWIWLPFLFGPAALLALIVAVMLSPKPRALYNVASAVIAVGFVVGASIASSTGSSLY